MSKRESISRYNIIIKRLRNHPSSFEEIADHLELESEIQGYDFNISKRTFHRDKNDILSLYNIEILYDKVRRVYYIDEESSDVSDRILEAFDVFNALNLSDRLSNYIHFENRKPKGTENLNEILQAIKDRKLIYFDYQKFWDEESSSRKAEPYALKEFKNRWYLIAKEENEKLVKIFALDRLSNLQTSRSTFKYPEEFNIQDYFRNCFGIIGPNAKNPSSIILSFTAFQGKYIKTLPLHESQKILIDNDEELRIELKLYLTTDFLMELLSYGEDLKVIKPKKLIDELTKTARHVLLQYEEN